MVENFLLPKNIDKSKFKIACLISFIIISIFIFHTNSLAETKGCDRQKVLKKIEDILEGSTNIHAYLALGKNLNKLVESNLVYDAANDLIIDSSHHPGQAVIVLIKASNQDWNRVFKVPTSATVSAKQGVSNVNLSLLEITKKHLKILGTPYVYAANANREYESSTDEWSLMLIAYALSNPELKAYITSNNLRATSLFPSPDYTKAIDVNIDDYIKGTQIELEKAEKSQEGATCKGAHAEDALLLYAGVQKTSKINSTDMMQDLILKLKTFAELEDLDETSVNDLAHRLDTVFRQKSDYKYSDKQISLIYKLQNRLCRYTENYLVKKRYKSYNLLGHIYLALDGTVAK